MTKWYLALSIGAPAMTSVNGNRAGTILYNYESYRAWRVRKNRRV